jgi:hypothetical protein
MYSRFLKEAGYEESAIAHDAAERWTALAIAAREASEPEEADPKQWEALASKAGDVLEAEERLWTGLAGSG